MQWRQLDILRWLACQFENGSDPVLQSRPYATDQQCSCYACLHQTICPGTIGRSALEAVHERPERVWAHPEVLVKRYRILSYWCRINGEHEDLAPSLLNAELECHDV